CSLRIAWLDPDIHVFNPSELPHRVPEGLWYRGAALSEHPRCTTCRSAAPRRGLAPRTDRRQPRKQTCADPSLNHLVNGWKSQNTAGPSHAQSLVVPRVIADEPGQSLLWGTTCYGNFRRLPTVSCSV